MLNDEAVLNLQRANGGSFKTTLCEPISSTPFGVKLIGIPDQSIVFSLDSFFDPPRLFTGSSGEKKRADYIAISTSEKRACVIELKCSERHLGPHVQGIKSQLRGGYCFLRYMESVLEKFYNYPKAFDGWKFNYSCVCISSKTRRRTTKISNDSNDIPEYFRKFFVKKQENIHFSKL